MKLHAMMLKSNEVHGGMKLLIIKTKSDTFHRAKPADRITFFTS